MMPPTHPTAVMVGAVLRQAREQLGLTLRDVTERSSITTPQYVSNIEHGRIDARASKHWESIVGALQLDGDLVNALLGGTDAPALQPDHVAHQVPTPVTINVSFAVRRWPAGPLAFEADVMTGPHIYVREVTRDDAPTPGRDYVVLVNETYAFRRATAVADDDGWRYVADGHLLPPTTRPYALVVAETRFLG